MKIEIAKMKEEHICAIAEIEKECFSAPWSEGALSSELQNDNARFFAAISDKTVLGYAGMNFVLDEGYITNVAVSEKFRNRGVAQLLLNRLHECFSELSLSFISLEVRKSNIPAMNLYSKNGYEIVGERKGFYRLPDEDAYIMTKYFKEEEILK